MNQAQRNSNHEHITVLLDNDILAHTAKDRLHLAVGFPHKNIAFFNNSGIAKRIT